MELLLVGTSHRVAPASARERMVTSLGDTASWLAQVRAAHSSITEALVLATCHRLEFYVATSDPAEAVEMLSGLLDGHAGATDPSRAGPDGSRFVRTGIDAAAHLCRVACGLDSVIVGEAEIAGQVRRAATAAREAGTVGRCLDRAIAGALRASGRARSETRIAHGVMSASSAAVALATHLAGSLADRTVLVIGAGEAGRLALSRLARHGRVRRLVASRSPHHARQAAEAFGAEPLPLAGIDDAMTHADVVIAAVQTPAVLVTEQMCRAAMAGRDGRPLVIVDLSMPHAVDPSAGGIPGVALRTVDDLGDIARQSAEHRLREIPAVEAIARDEARRALAGVRDQRR